MTTTADTLLDPPPVSDETPDRTVVGRLNTIMSAFAGGDRALTLSDISHRVGLPKSTVHRLADQLCSTGWLERNSGGYRIGLKLLELGGVALQRNNLREIASRHLYPLAFKTGLSAQLAIYDQGSVVFLERISLVRLDLPSRVGGREPAYCTALGKAMLAFQGETEVAAALAPAGELLPRRTAATITDPRALRAELDVVRRVGVAYDRAENHPGVGCVAAPVRSGGQAIGAVSISGPIDRLRSPSLAHDVRAAALAVWEGRTAAVRPSR